MATSPLNRLNTDVEMIERMEVDLASKAAAGITAATITAQVYGIFSLEDLEEKIAKDLCQGIAVGVGYIGAESSDFPARNSGPTQAPGGNAAEIAYYLFGIILAVPYGKDCEERYDATKLLSILRRSIFGKNVSGDVTNRVWAFVKEFPNISDSTDTVIYYTQVWRLALPLNSNI